MLHPNLLWSTLHDHILLCFAIWTGYQLPWGRCSALKIIDAYLACDSRQPGHNQEEQSRQMPGMPFSCKNLSRVVAKVFVIKYFLPSSVCFPPPSYFVHTTQYISMCSHLQTLVKKKFIFFSLRRVLVEIVHFKRIYLNANWMYFFFFFLTFDCMLPAVKLKCSIV